jgi:glycerol-3-phosphate acyltransferase PlsY
MDFLVSSIIGYVLGSFPTAYLILKSSKGMDITKFGTGNVGAMNAFDVSKSKILGLLVFLIDALKGLLSVYIILLIFPLNFSNAAISLVFSVFSHCYNPWIGFKGGRGLATATGGSLILFPFLFFLWCLIWIGIYLIKKDVIWANFIATVSSMVTVMLFIENVIQFAFPKPSTETTLLFFSTTLLIIILTKHFEPFFDLLKNKENNSANRNKNE